jgi:hypothetical protein
MVWLLILSLATICIPMLQIPRMFAGSKQVFTPGPDFVAIYQKKSYNQV